MPQTAHRKPHLDALAVGLLLTCSLLWGFQQVLVKLTLNEIPPIFQAALRFMGATVLLGLWCRWRGIALFQRDGSLGAGLLAGGLFALEFSLVYAGLQFTSASRLTIFLYTSPFWVALLLPLWIGAERLRALQWSGLALAFAAVLFALRDGLSHPMVAQQWQGDLMALGAGLAWALTTVTIRTTRLAHVTPEKLLFYQLGVSALTMPLLSWLLAETWVWHFSAFAWTSLLLQTVVVAFVSYLAWMWMLSHYQATKLSVFVFLTPVCAMLFGTWFLHEAITPTLLGSLILVALGIVLVNRKPALG